MNKYIQQKLAMYNVVRQLMEQNAPTWNTIPAVVSVFSDFNTKIAELEELGMKQAAKIEGYAKSKSKLTAVTIEQMHAIAGALVVYAGTINDEVLKARARVSTTQVSRASKERLLAMIDEILDLGTEHSAELVSFGVSAAHIDALNNNFMILKEQVYAVRTEIIKRKQLTAAIFNISKDTDALLTSGLDQLMKMLKTIDAKFYEKYKSARMIIHYGVKHKLPPSNLGKPTGFLSA